MLVTSEQATVEFGAEDAVGAHESSTQGQILGFQHCQQDVTYMGCKYVQVVGAFFNKGQDNAQGDLQVAGSVSVAVGLGFGIQEGDDFFQFNSTSGGVVEKVTELGWIGLLVDAFARRIALKNELLVLGIKYSHM